jgi:hypothetical protein
MPVDHTVVLGVSERIVRLERLVVEIAEQLFWSPRTTGDHARFKERIIQLRDELKAAAQQ